MGARGPWPKAKTDNTDGGAINRAVKKGGAAESGDALPVMRHPPHPLPKPAAAWYGRLVRRRSPSDPEPLLPVAALRREDSLLVASLAQMLAALDTGFDRHLMREANALMEKLGCSPASRTRFNLAPATKAKANEFDGFS